MANTAKDSKKNIKKIVAGVLAVIMLGSSCTAVVAGIINTKKKNQTGTTISVGTGSFDFSKAFDENGYFKDVKALDYVDLADYKNIEVPAELKTITEDQLNTALDNLSQNYPITTYDTTAGTVVSMNDTVNIDYVGSVDGVEFVGGNTQGTGTDLTLGSGTYIGAEGDCEGFEDQVAGHSVGETFDITVQFPRGYSDSSDADGNTVTLAEQVAVFTVTINSIKTTSYPEINDEFVKENLADQYENYEDLVNFIEKTVTTSQIENYVWNEIIDNSTIKETPKAVEEYLKELSEYNRATLLEEMEEYASYYGVTVDTIVAMYGCSSFDEYYEYYGQDPMSDMDAVIIAQALCEAEGLVMNDELLQKFFSEIVGVDDYSSYETTFGKNYLNYAALSSTVLEQIMDYIK